MYFRTNTKFEKRIAFNSCIFIYALAAGALFWQIDWDSTNARADLAQPSGSHQSLAGQVDGFDRVGKPFLESYCLDCHDGPEGEGGIDLSTFQSSKDVTDSLDLWGNVLRQVESGRMPPEGNSQPASEEVEKLGDWLMDDVANHPLSGEESSQLRRLSRTEYENTIRDLFRVPRSCFNNNSKIIQTNDYFQPATGKLFLEFA